MKKRNVNGQINVDASNIMMLSQNEENDYFSSLESSAMLHRKILKITNQNKKSVMVTQSIDDLSIDYLLPK